VATLTGRSIDLNKQDTEDASFFRKKRKRKQMKRKENMPVFVYWGLWGIKKRFVAMCFLWVSVIMGVVSVLLGFTYPRAFFGILLFLAAFWYGYAMRWVDKNSAWDEE
jgi:hypothetical protein